jgi:hypothetical protein
MRPYSLAKKGAERSLPLLLRPYHIMEILATVGLVGNTVQFVDFSSKLILESV